MVADPLTVPVAAYASGTAWSDGCRMNPS